jgi:uncharacterized membrane protein (UPF0127 family)
VFAVLAPTLFYQPATARLRVRGKTVALEIANTDAERAKGLGGRRSLAPDKGMIFVFAKPGRQCFWMKDMYFSLDMVFINHAKRVVRIQPDILPKTYPKSFCADSTQYVVELGATQAEKLGVRTGQKLNF